MIAINTLNVNFSECISSYKYVFNLDSSFKLKAVTENDIINLVCDYFEIMQDEIKGKCREDKYLHPRYYAILLIKQNTKLTLKEIGKLFSGRDHSTVINSLKTIKNFIENYKEFTDEFENLKIFFKNNNFNLK